MAETIAVDEDQALAHNRMGVLVPGAQAVPAPGKTRRECPSGAQERLDAPEARYGRFGAPMMAMSRKDALKRFNGLAPRVEEHLQKIANNPASRDVPHWIGEINHWIERMEDLLPHAGDKTAAQWAARIAEWKARLGG
jgi:hypothetical protein